MRHIFYCSQSAGMSKTEFDDLVERDNLGETCATIWIRLSERGHRQVIMLIVAGKAIVVF